MPIDDGPVTPTARAIRQCWPRARQFSSKRARVAATIWASRARRRAAAAYSYLPSTSVGTALIVGARSSSGLLPWPSSFRQTLISTATGTNLPLCSGPRVGVRSPDDTGVTHAPAVRSTSTRSYQASYRRLVVQMYADLVGDLVDAEDAVQEAFVTAVRKRRPASEAVAEPRRPGCARWP